MGENHHHERMARTCPPRILEVVAQIDKLKVDIHSLNLSRYQEREQWEAQYKANMEELKTEEAFSFHVQITYGKWFTKYEQVLKLSQPHHAYLPKRIKHVDDEMTYKNIPHVVFHLIHFC